MAIYLISDSQYSPNLVTDSMSTTITHSLHACTYVCRYLTIYYPHTAVAQSVERRTHVQGIRSSVSSRVKLMTFISDACHFLEAWRSEVMEYGSVWLF